MNVDQVYRVLLQGTARAQANGGLSLAQVTIDPLIAIDPSFADGIAALLARHTRFRRE